MDSLRTSDGIALHLRRWNATTADSRGLVLIVHGLGEHIGRYDAVAQTLAALGWQVLGYDQRGHGRSEGARGDIAHADSLYLDLASVIDHAREQTRGQTRDQTRDNAPRKLVLLGHSMGGLVAARFVAEGLAAQPSPWSRAVDALVLSSPALELGMNAAQRLALKVLGKAAPHLAVSNGLKARWISRDAAVVRAYEQDALVHDRITPALVRCMLDGGEFVRSRAAFWRVPTLLLWAGADRCVDPDGSALFVAAAPTALLTAQVFPELFHEIFNEPERDEVLARLSSWLASSWQATQSP